jgi:hypothetical protein
MSIEGYLKHYAEPEVSLVSTLTECWQYAVVVPCCDEFEGVPPLLASLERAAVASAAKAVVVLVVNGREDAAERVHETNRRLIEQLGGVGLHSHSSRLDLLVIDRASPALRLPSRQGVGLARKIGCDVVTALHQGGQLASRWIWTTDGDVEVPVDYFTTVQEHSESVAINLPFVHVELPSQPRAAAAIRLYDLSLRYYVAGLAHAGSPYAFHTIGSTMVVRIDAYAKVRGFPRRQAAEDFHLLSKLAKVGSVASGSGAPLRVQGRVSDRVPFGTGAAVSKLVAEKDPEASFRLYDPRCFDELKLWLSSFQAYSKHRNESQWRTQIAASSGLSGQIRERAISELKILSAMQRAVDASASESVVSRHLETWFDGLKTLRFVHLVRDHQWPKLPWRDAVAQAPFMDLE